MRAGAETETYIVSDAFGALADTLSVILPSGGKLPLEKCDGTPAVPSFCKVAPDRAMIIAKRETVGRSLFLSDSAQTWTIATAGEPVAPPSRFAEVRPFDSVFRELPWQNVVRVLANGSEVSLVNSSGKVGVILPVALTGERKWLDLLVYLPGIKEPQAYRIEIPCRDCERSLRDPLNQ